MNGISTFDAAVKLNDVLIVSGASIVPGLSSVVIEHLRDEFSIISSLKYGISPGQKVSRGLTTA